MMATKRKARGRATGGIRRPSQITRKAPSKRLVKRRTRTLSAPKGFFANPSRGKSKRSVTRVSQITKKAPSKRLVRRRRKTLTAPKGFFANPVKHGYTVTARGAELATFKTRQHAIEYGQAFANAHHTQVKIEK